MRHVRRALEPQLLTAMRQFPAVALTGPRRSGKTWLLRRLFPGAEYFLLEADFVVPRRSGGLTLVECKHTKTATPGMAAPMRRLADVVRRRPVKRASSGMYLVHDAARHTPRTEAVAPGVRALRWRRFVDDVL